MTMKTEEEAQKTGCPLTRFKTLCVASQCMAWRWEPVECWERRAEDYEDSLDIGGINSREEPRPKGYCGLAGKPD